MPASKGSTPGSAKLLEADRIVQSSVQRDPLTLRFASASKLMASLGFCAPHAPASGEGRSVLLPTCSESNAIHANGGAGDGSSAPQLSPRRVRWGRTGGRGTASSLPAFVFSPCSSQFSISLSTLLFVYFFKYRHKPELSSAVERETETDRKREKKKSRCQCG